MRNISDIYLKAIVHILLLRFLKNKVVSVSEKFLNKGAMENIITLIKTNALKAEIDKMTYSM